MAGAFHRSGLTVVILLAGLAGAQAQGAPAIGGAPIAPGSGFANGGTPSFRGGAPVAPGSGFAPSTAGTLDSGPRAIRTPPPVIVDRGVRPRTHARSRQKSRRPRPEYPGVPDIMAPAD